MEKEIAALEHTNTWSLVPLPPGKRAIGCRYIYKIKHHADGSIERYKSRLVAKGDTQAEGVDYTDTFAPVAKMVTVRTILALAAAHKWNLQQLDVNNAFLHGDLDEDIYMEPPPGYSKTVPGLVCKLNKSLYGLKQASRQWFAKLTSFLLSIGYEQSPTDHSLFTQSENEDFTIVLVYVDDILVTGTSSICIQELKQSLDTKFSIKDLGKAKYYLGLEITRSSHGLFLNQRKYILDLLEDTKMLDAKPLSLPMEQHLKLNSSDGVPLTDPSTYRKIIGKLIYLTVSRPDISYTIHCLSQFMNSPTSVHLQAVTRVLRYLKGTQHKG